MSSTHIGDAESEDEASVVDDGGVSEEDDGVDEGGADADLSDSRLVLSALEERASECAQPSTSCSLCRRKGAKKGLGSQTEKLATGADDSQIRRLWFRMPLERVCRSNPCLYAGAGSHQQQQQR